MKINEITIFEIKLNSWNGFSLTILAVEICNFDRALFGVYVGSDFLIMYVFFRCFEFGRLTNEASKYGKK